MTEKGGAKAPPNQRKEGKTMKKNKHIYSVTMPPMTYKDFLRKQRQHMRNRRNGAKYERGLFWRPLSPTGNTRAAMMDRAGRLSQMWH